MNIEADMVYILDPKECNGSCFLLDEYQMNGDFFEYLRANKPIPAGYFPESLTVIDANQELPDMFHTTRGFIVFSERARALMEERAPGQVEFIPVTFHAVPKLVDRLNLASAYYFINVLGRAQRLLWLEMPSRAWEQQEDGVERFSYQSDYGQWRVRERAKGEPLIWRESWWRTDKREYRGHVDILMEDVLWQELNSKFPDQLNPNLVGQ
jgi:hypothetical protein